MKQERQFSKKSNWRQYATELMCDMKGKFSKIIKTIYYSMLFNLCAYWNETRGFSKNNNLLLYAVYWNETTKKTIYYSMLFNLCAYWNETRGTVFKKTQFITVCYSTCVRIEMKQERQFSKKSNWWQYATELMCEMKGQFSKNQNNLLQYAFQLQLCVHIEMKQEGQFSKKQQKKQFITVCYYAETRTHMLFNLCAYWNETRGAVFKKNNNLLQYAFQLMCVLKWNKRAVFKKIQLMTICYWTHVRNEGAVFKKIKTIYYSMLFNCVCILKWNKRDCFQKNNNLLPYLLTVCWNKRGSFQQFITVCYSMWNETRGTVFKKTTIYYCMLFNLCAYWNETRGSFWKKSNCFTELMCEKVGQFSKKTIYYSMLFNLCAYWNETRGQFSKKSNWWQYATQLMCEMKGQFSKNQNNLLQYAIQLVCILKWNKRDSFQKNNNLLQYAIQLVCILKWNKEGLFSKNNNLLLYAVQLVCILKWNKEGQFSKKTIYYSMLFNLCAYWNETRGQFSKNNNLLQYAFQLVCILKWNKRGSFQKNPIDDNILLNSCATWRGSFQKNQNNLLQYAFQPVWCILKWNNRDCFQKNKKKQFITVCYSTCVRIEMKQEGQFSKKTIYYNLLRIVKQDAIQLVCVLKWNKRAVFKKQQFITVCYSTCVRIEMKQERQFSKKSNWWQYATELMCDMKGQFSKKSKQFITVCFSTVWCILKWNNRDCFQKKKKKNNLLQYAIQLVCSIEMKQEGSFQKTTKKTIYYSMLFNLCAYWNETRGAVFKKSTQFITVCYSTCVRIEMKQEGQFSKNNNLLQYAIQLVCILKWNKRDSFQKNNNLLQYAIQLVCILKWNKRDSFQKTTKKTIYYSMLFNMKVQFCVRYWKQEGSFQKKQFITVCYSTCVHIEMKQEGQFSKNKTIYYSMLFNLCAYWNETRGVFKTTTIYYSMLFNLCAYWNETRGDVFKKTTKKTIYYSMLFNLCAYWNETRGAVFKKQQFITVCYSTCVRIEMKQEGQFSKKTTIYYKYAIQLVCVLKWNKRDRAVLWNESFQKYQNNLLQYAFQLMCILKWNKRGSFQKNPIDDNILLNSCATWRGSFQKNQNNLLQYAFQPVWCILKWNNRDCFQKTTKKTIYYSMLFNLCAYWNETRGTVFKKQQFNNIITCVRIEMFSKKQQFITVYSTCVRIEMKQEGQFSKKKQITQLKWNCMQFYNNLFRMLFNLCAYWNETRGAVFKKQQIEYATIYYSIAIQLVCVLKWNKRDSFQKNPIDDNMLLNSCATWRGSFQKNQNNLLQYAFQLMCILKWNKRGSFQKNPIDDNMLLNSCATWRGSFQKNQNNLLQYAFQLVCILKWNKRGFQKTTIYYCMLFNFYWKNKEGHKKNNLLQYAIQLVCILKWNKRDSFQKNTIYYSMLFNLCAYWNETRGTFSKKSNLLQYAIQLMCILKWNKRAVFKKTTTIYYSMLFNYACVHIEMKQEGLFSKKQQKKQFITIQLVCVLKWNKRGSFQKIQFITVCYSTHVRIEMKQEGQFSKKKQFITVCYSTCVRIEMKQEGSFQKNPIDDNMLLNSCAKWRGSFQKYQNNLLQYAYSTVCAYWNETRGTVFKKKTIYYSMLFNLCAYWNETRGADSMFSYWNEKNSFQKKQQFITVCYSTCVHIEMKQEGQFSKKSNWTILLHVCKRGSFQQFITVCVYWNETREAVFKKIQLMTILLLNSCATWRGSFQKNQNNLLQYAFQPVWCILKWNNRDCFQKTTKKNNLLQYAIQLVCVLKWNKRDSFQKNLCAYWNETKRGSFQKKQFITVCYSTCVHIEMKQEGKFSKKHQFITVCCSTCVHIEMKQEGQFSKKNNLLQYAIQLVCVLKWNKRGSFQKNNNLLQYAYSTCVRIEMKQREFSKKTTKKTIYYSMLFNLCAYWNETRGTVFKKQQFITVCYSTHVRIEMKQEGQFSKKSNWWQYATQLMCEMKQEGQFSKNNNLLQYAFQLMCILK